MSLRLRLSLFLGILNLGFLLVLLTLWLGNQRASIAEEITAAHRVTVQLLGTTVQATGLMGPAPQVMEGFLHHLGRVRANEIRLYDSQGRLRYVSPPSHYKADRRAPEFFARLMTPSLEATGIDLPGVRLLIVPDASRAVLDAWDDLTNFVLLWLAFLVVLQAGVLLFLRHLLRPAEALLGGLDELAHGHFATRLKESQVSEWRELTSGFNRVAEALERGQAEQRELLRTTEVLAENREVTRFIESGIEAERKRLARELHDELGQSVTAIRLIATSLARRPETGAEIAAGAGKINEVAAGLYDSVQRIVHELRPAVLESSDLAAALEELAREWRQRHPEIALTLVTHGDCSHLGEVVTLAAFRMAQEALTNVLKHAAASQVTIELRRETGRLCVRVCDNGRGGKSHPGMRRGLAGMRERAALLGGTLAAGPGEDGGFCVILDLPLNGDKDET